MFSKCCSMLRISLQTHDARVLTIAYLFAAQFVPIWMSALSLNDRFQCWSSQMCHLMFHKSIRTYDVCLLLNQPPIVAHCNARYLTVYVSLMSRHLKSVVRYYLFRLACIVFICSQNVVQCCTSHSKLMMLMYSEFCLSSLHISFRFDCLLSLNDCNQCWSFQMCHFMFHKAIQMYAVCLLLNQSLIVAHY